MKKNCWEVVQCKFPQSCPAFNEDRLDGTHGGKNAGRCCWVVAGTLCFGVLQGERTQKITSCEECDFYHYVKIEEGQNFSLILPLLCKLNENYFIPEQKSGE